MVARQKHVRLIRRSVQSEVLIEKSHDKPLDFRELEVGDEGQATEGFRGLLLLRQEVYVASGEKDPRDAVCLNKSQTRKTMRKCTANLS
jgi:hypothetical protein